MSSKMTGSLSFDMRAEGKTATQNFAMAFIDSEIIVITDADTVFDVACLDRLSRCFADPDVGAVDGRLKFIIDGDDAVSSGQGRYWIQELAIREAESLLGILAVMFKAGHGGSS